MNLYQIDAALLDCIDMETGEIDEIRYNKLEMDRDQKIENTALYIKNLTAMAEALKAEKNALAEREKSAKLKAESLKAYLSGYLAGSKFETPKVKVSFRRSESVRIAEGAKLPEEYTRTKLTIEPDKAKLKEAIKAGESIDGVVLVESQNISIK